jgi:hypothetical protein
MCAAVVSGISAFVGGKGRGEPYLIGCKGF